MRRVAIIFAVALSCTVSAPSALAAGASPTFTFSTDASNPQTTCSLDGAPTSDCISPQSYTGLTADTHTFTQTTTFTVTLPAPPTAAFSFSPTNPSTGQSVHFDGTASTCPAGTCTYGYEDATGATLITGQSGDYTFQTAGTQQVTLSVTDQYGQTSTVEHDVVVSQPVTGSCQDTSGVFADNFDTHYNAAGGLNPNACPGPQTSQPGDNPGATRPSTWEDQAPTRSPVPADCFMQGTPPSPGQGSGALKIYANGNHQGSTAQDCLWLNHWRYISYPSDTYYGAMWYFPSPGYNDPAPGGHDIISEFDWHPFISSGPEGYTLHGDTLQWRVRTGQWCHLCTAQYDNGAEYENPDASQVSGNLAPIQNWRVIPPSGWQTNTWMETIVHVHWASDATGQVEAWYRPKGSSTWIKSIDQSGFPTLDWGPDECGCFTWSPSNQHGVTTMDHFGIYRTAQANAPSTTFWLDNFSEQPTFAGAATRMP